MARYKARQCPRRGLEQLLAKFCTSSCRFRNFRMARKKSEPGGAVVWYPPEILGVQCDAERAPAPRRRVGTQPLSDGGARSRTCRRRPLQHNGCFWAYLSVAPGGQRRDPFRFWGAWQPRTRTANAPSHGNGDRQTTSPEYDLSTCLLVTLSLLASLAKLVL